MICACPFGVSGFAAGPRCLFQEWCWAPWLLEVSLCGKPCDIAWPSHLALSPKPPVSREKAGPGVLLLQVQGQCQGYLAGRGTRIDTWLADSRAGDSWLSGAFARDVDGWDKRRVWLSRDNARHGDGEDNAGDTQAGSLWARQLSLDKQLVVAGLAVHLVTRLTEGALLQPAQAVGADEVLRVVPAPHGRDAGPGDGAAAAVAEGALPQVEVQLAVGPPLQLEEGPSSEASQALLGEGEGKAGTALGTPPFCAFPPSHSPCTRSTRCARHPAGPTGNCP